MSGNIGFRSVEIPFTVCKGIINCMLNYCVRRARYTLVCIIGTDSSYETIARCLTISIFRSGSYNISKF